MDNIRNMTEKELLQRVSDIKNMTEEELLQRAKELLIKYEFSHFALDENRIPLGIEVPKELEAQWRKEYYEELVETFDWSNEKCIYKIRDILGYGLVNNNFSLLDKFCNRLLDYRKLDNDKRRTIISYIFQLSDSIKKEKESNLGGNMLCQTTDQKEYIKKLFDLAEKIYFSIDQKNLNLPKLSPDEARKFSIIWKTEEERKKVFIRGLENSISTIRENRKIIGL